MSALTSSLRLVSILAVILAVPGLARGDDELENAQNARSRAYNDYYKALTSGGAKTQEEKDALYQKLVQPANVELNRVEQEKQAEAVKSFMEHPDGNTRRPRDTLPSSKRGKPIVGRTDAERNAKVPAKGAGAPKAGEPEAAPAGPETVLDGSGLPKELEFRKRKAAEAKKKRGPSPTPSPDAPAVPAPESPAPDPSASPSPAPSPGPGLDGQDIPAELEFAAPKKPVKPQKKPAH